MVASMREGKASLSLGRQGGREGGITCGKVEIMHLTYKMMELKARKASSSGGCAKVCRSLIYWS